jgi:uncharacterized iron-regulated membrane protein
MRIKHLPLRKLAGQLHLWLGLSSGIVIFILGITGCIYTFIDEIRPLVYHDRIFIPEAAAHSKMMPLQELQLKARRALKKDVPLLDIEVFTDRKHSMVFRYRNRNDAANFYPAYFINYDKVYLNPYTGAILSIENTKWEFFNIIIMLHCSLLLGYLGKQIIIWSTIIFLIMLVSGIILWWPKNKAAAAKRFSFKWNAETSWKRKNYDLHQIPAFYILIISFFVALSGLSMILPKLDQGITYLINGGHDSSTAAMIHTSHMGGSKTQVEAKAGILNKVAAHALVMNPDADRYRIFSPKNDADPLIIKNYKAAHTHYAYLQDNYNQANANHMSTIHYSDLSAGEKVHELTYDIHVGAIFGLPGKILVFLASLITASLPLSGFLIWRGRRRKNNIII